MAPSSRRSGGGVRKEKNGKDFKLPKVAADSDNSSGDELDLSDDERDVIESDENDDTIVNTSELKEFISRLQFSKQNSTQETTDKSRVKVKHKGQKCGAVRTSKIQHTEVSSTTRLNVSPKKTQAVVKLYDRTSVSSKGKSVDKKALKLKKTQTIKTLSATKSKSSLAAAEKIGLYEYKYRTTLLVKPGTNILDNKLSPEDMGQPPADTVKLLDDLAFKIFENETTVYSQQKDRHKRSEGGWMKTVVASGTLGDKMAALTVQVQESPLHGVGSLDILVNMARKKGRRENSQAIEALQELFLTSILPDARPLISFEQRPLETLAAMTSGNKDAFDRTLLCWYVESQFKAKYLLFVKAVEVLTFDTVPASKKSAIDAIYKLLSSKAEQEQLLLSILVNKMGDSDHKVASKSAYLLNKLVAFNNHPNLRGTVVKEVENLIYRPNISSRAQYYAVCFLGQIVLTRGDVELANKLITIHLSFFKIYIQKGEVDRKMMSGLLSGVNRAYPFSRVDKDQINGLINDLYRLVHTINFNTSVQALLLLFQVNNATDNTSDRFYTAIYKKLHDPALKQSNKHSLLLNLLYKTITTDPCNERVKAFVKRLLQVCSHQLPPFICGALFLVSEVLRRNTHLSLNKDVRYSQQHRHNDPAVSNALSYRGDADDDDGQEHFRDAPNRDSDTESVEGGHAAVDEGTDVAPSWHHQFVKPQGDKRASCELYDPLHRNPRYCHGDRECVWELEQLANHYHPSVALFAASILKGEAMSYDGDPLRDFTLIRFLDRFAFKNPKRSTSDSGSAATLRRRDYKPRGLRALALGSTAYLQTSEVHVPPEEKFLYQYFKRQGSKSKPRDESDDESIGDDEFDAYLETVEMKESSQDLMDFASEIGQIKKKKKGDGDSADDSSDDEMEFDADEMRKMMGDDDDSDGGHSGDDEGGESEGGESSDGELDRDDGSEPFNEEDIAFSDEDGQVRVKGHQSRKHKMSDVGAEGGGAGRKKAKGDMTHLFAAADEFASVLDDNSSLKTDTIGTSALSNRDKASTKQLAWEAKQQKWLNDSDWKMHKQGNVKHKGHTKHTGAFKQQGASHNKGKQKRNVPKRSSNLKRTKGKKAKY